jgi:acetyltransferase
VISFGAGGTAVEILKDSAVALPPLNAVLAERLIEHTRVARLLSAFRRMPAADRPAVVRMLLRLSEMVCELPQVRELDINPLLVDERGARVVDVRIFVERPPVRPEPYAHMAIHPYPSAMEHHTRLADGTELVIRPMRPEDAEMEREFVRELSPQSKYMRFMQSIKELTPEMLVRFTQPDYDREMALIAVVTTGGRRREVGVARYAINPDGESCEFALVVSDEWHKHGIGSRLMQHLMEAARERGLELMVGAVLAENRPMLNLCRELGFTVRTAPDDPGVRIVERRL